MSGRTKYSPLSVSGQRLKDQPPQWRPNKAFSSRSDNPRSMAAGLQLLQCALQLLQFSTGLRELSSSGQLLIVGEVPSRLGDQGADVGRSCGRPLFAAR